MRVAAGGFAVVRQSVIVSVVVVRRFRAPPTGRSPDLNRLCPFFGD